MSWEKTNVNGYPAAYEDLTLPTGASTDTPTSPIDFIPAGRPFTIFANSGATNLASAAPLDVQGSLLGAGGPWSTLEADLIADIDNAVTVAKYDPANDADHVPLPALRLLLDHAGNQTGESVRIYVIWSDEDPQ